MEESGEELLDSIAYGRRFKIVFTSKGATKTVLVGELHNNERVWALDKC